MATVSVSDNSNSSSRGNSLTMRNGGNDSDGDNDSDGGLLSALTQSSADRWYFSHDQLLDSKSRRCGIDADTELAYRQQTANLIQDMGQHLRVSQLCINTAIVYMHRFYAIHSFTIFDRNAMAAATLFLAAKLQDQPRKMEHVIKVSHICLHQGDSQASLDTHSKLYLDQVEDLILNENVLVKTLGFDLDIDHPHTHIVQLCNLVMAPKDLAKTSYFMASNTLHLTTMCLQYKPTVVACFCIHLACKWSNWSIPLSKEGKQWFYYVDRTVTNELLDQLISKFLHIFDHCPARLKMKIISTSNSQDIDSSQQSSSNLEPSKEFSLGNMEKNEADKRSQDVFDSSNPSNLNQNKSGTRKIDYREYKRRQQQHDRKNPPNLVPSNKILKHNPADMSGSSQFKNSSNGECSQTQPSSKLHQPPSNLAVSYKIPRHTPVDTSGSMKLKDSSSNGQLSQTRPSSQLHQPPSNLAVSYKIPKRTPVDTSGSMRLKNSFSNGQVSQAQTPSQVNQPSSNRKSKNKLESMRPHPYQSSSSLSHPLDRTLKPTHPPQVK